LTSPVAVGVQALPGATVQFVGNEVRLTLNGATRVVATDDPARLDPLFAQFAVVSPDAKTLVYLTASGEDFLNTSFTKVNLSTLAKSVIAKFPSNYWVHAPRWSSDSKHLAYVMQDPRTGVPQVWIMDAGGNHAHMVATGGALTAHSMEGFLANAPSWSADDKSIVFYDSAFQPTQQWVVSVAIGARTSIASSGVRPYSCVGGCRLCSLPDYKQSGQSYSNVVMQYGGDTIGAAGCALVTLTDLFDYYGSTVGNPGGMANCLNPWQYADPVNWSGAVVNPPSGPGCDKYTTNYINSVAFSWSTLDIYLKAGHPVIVGICYDGTTCHDTHFFVVVGGDGSHNEANYYVNDPASGSTVAMSTYAGTHLNVMELYQPAGGTWPACE
jgi:hypothetical protein